jgi:VIT1/CCC1 family predicted Fe2+/Mn2+ transporter
MRHSESHRSHRIGWLRAAVLGANDGIVSTASLIVGVSAADTPRSGILVAGLAGLVAGAMSMAAGEYVSVSSQADTEGADLARERRELAAEVATQLMAKDALAAHARDELGITEELAARPVQAAFASAGTFTLGAALPLLLVLAFPAAWLAWGVSIASLGFLALLGSVAARAGGSPVLKSAARVTFWGALAMALTAAVGALFGARL